MRLGKVTSTLKKRLQASGDAVVAYQPLGDLPNFFRVAFTGAGHVDESEAEKLLDLMEHHGSDL
jgi:inosine/xanthosine triphosphate pyrophosphatase family protein